MFRTHALALKSRKQKAGIETEKATKNAFVMPSSVPCSAMTWSILPR
jgi:hypothetical protein